MKRGQWALTIVAGIIACQALHNFAGISDTISFVFGLIVMFALQLAFRARGRSNAFQREMDRIVADHKAGRPLIDDDGNRIL